MKDNELLLLLLQTIRVNGNTMYLLEHGYTLFTLTRDIDLLKDQGLVKSKDQGLFLTKKGETFFYSKNQELGRRGLYKYLSSIVKLKKDPMSLDSVYVPPKRGRGKKKQDF